MKREILIVEDELVLLNILIQKFESAGFKVICAANGEEGLEKALKKHPDLILLDILMPVMDGIKMLEELRKDTWGKKVPVYMLTNLSNTEKEFSSSHLDVAGYLIKCNLSIDEVVGYVKKKLD